MPDAAGTRSLELYLHDHGQDDFGPECRIDFESVHDKENSGYPINLSPKEMELISLLLAANPQGVRDLLNKIAVSAYNFGLEHGSIADGIILTDLSPSAGLPPGRFCEIFNQYQASLQESAPAQEPDEPAEPIDFGGRLTGFGFRS